jgi:hypothetical protein
VDEDRWAESMKLHGEEEEKDIDTISVERRSGDRYRHN